MDHHGDSGAMVWVGMILVAGIVESRIQNQVPWKTCHVVGPMHVTTQSPSVGMVWKFRERVPAQVSSSINLRRGLPCHEFEPSTTKDPPCRAAMHVKSVES
ncbi:hypothetical protein TNCV_1232961 [Trichonephila clavipes]|nr:hypothetical protein TNCV_1232961 [Trichonephila clavipes]